MLTCDGALTCAPAVDTDFVDTTSQQEVSRYTKNSDEGKKAGQWIAGGFKGVLVQLGGDLDYLAKYLGLPRSSLHSNPCGMCKCTFHGVLSWMDNRECAAWIRSLVTVSNWKEHLKSDCILFQLAGLNALSIAFDWMHNAYLGWLQYFYGSVLFFLVYHILPHDPLTNLIDTVAPFIKEYQKSNEVLQKYRPELSKLTMFEKKIVPKTSRASCRHQASHNL